MIEGIKIKFVETPPFYGFQQKVSFINMWINDMQRNGVTIISNTVHRRENPDGSVDDGFLIEYREEFEEAPLMMEAPDTEALDDF